MVKIIYTDGGCPSNGNTDAIGGWAYAILSEDGKEVEITNSGYFLSNPSLPNTSIRMELIAIIKGLESIKEPSKIALYSDSAYCVNGIKQQWYRKWLATGVNSMGKTPANLDLWTALIELLVFHEVRANHVKGHSGNKFNDLVDTLATEAIELAKSGGVR